MQLIRRSWPFRGSSLEVSASSPWRHHHANRHLIWNLDLGRVQDYLLFASIFTLWVFFWTCYFWWYYFCFSLLSYRKYFCAQHPKSHWCRLCSVHSSSLRYRDWNHCLWSYLANIWTVWGPISVLACFQRAKLVALTGGRRALAWLGDSHFSWSSAGLCLGLGRGPCDPCSSICRGPFDWNIDWVLLTIASVFSGQVASFLYQLVINPHLACVLGNILLLLFSGYRRQYHSWPLKAYYYRNLREHAWVCLPGAHL